MPFSAPPSQYVVLGSNITGGAPNLIVNNGTDNLALGNDVLTVNDSGSNNIGIGNFALNANISGFSNVAIGTYSMQVNVDGSQNVAIGEETLLSNIGGSRNVALGSRVMDLLEQGEENVAIGYLAASTLINGESNVAIGAFAMQGSDADAFNNVAVGSLALEIVGASNDGNVAVGYGAGGNTPDGDANVFVGSFSGSQMNTANNDNNAFVGAYSGAFGNGNSNVYVGAYAGQNNDANNNVFIGFSVCDTNTGIENAILIGKKSVEFDGLITSNAIVIGDSTNMPVFIGGIEFTGGGGFAAQATQNDASEVSIISLADDTVTTAGYSLQSLSGFNPESSFVMTANDNIANVAENHTLLAETGTIELSGLTGDNVANFNLSADVSSSGQPNVVYTLSSRLTGSRGDLTASVDANAGNATSQSELSVEVGAINAFAAVAISSDGATSSATLNITADVLTIVAPIADGANVPDFTQATAPVAGLTVTNWISVTLGGVAGYIPFLSA